MADVYIASDNIITSLGFTTEDNAIRMFSGETGIRLHEDVELAPEPFYASRISTSDLHSKFSTIDDPVRFTRFEQLAICSIKEALSGFEMNVTDTNTLFILSTTKGNVDLLEKSKAGLFERQRLYLWHTARLLQNYFRIKNEPLVISNACISGLQAILVGARLIRTGLYDQVIINGTDIISEFVLSGFNSFKSLSNGPCRPFDRTRDGLSLGEGSGTLILTGDKSLSAGDINITVGPGFSTNDANHISGPSRTGEGLYQAISRTMDRSEGKVDFINAHGTATPYNDEMESVAIARAGLQSVPINSYKGYWGHTLGAAGVIESIMGLISMKRNQLLATLGFNESGVTNPLAIIAGNTHIEVNVFLKIASGFGGCNAAVLFEKQ